jgi:hypothetical protein
LSQGTENSNRLKKTEKIESEYGNEMPVPITKREETLAKKFDKLSKKVDTGKRLIEIIKAADEALCEEATKKGWTTFNKRWTFNRRHVLRIWYGDMEKMLDAMDRHLKACATNQRLADLLWPRSTKWLDTVDWVNVAPYHPTALATIGTSDFMMAAIKKDFLPDFEWSEDQVESGEDILPTWLGQM